MFGVSHTGPKNEFLFLASAHTHTHLLFLIIIRSPPLPSPPLSPPFSEQESKTLLKNPWKHALFKKVIIIKKENN